jgi:hypothetical protein
MKYQLPVCRFCHIIILNVKYARNKAGRVHYRVCGTTSPIDITGVAQIQEEGATLSHNLFATSGTI